MSVQNLKLIFSQKNGPNQKPKAPSRAEISKRLSRSMERWRNWLSTLDIVKQFCEQFSVESIVQHLSQFGEPSPALLDEKVITEPKILRRVSSSHNVLKHLRNVSQTHLMIMIMWWFRSERRSASMSNIDAEDLKQFNIDLGNP